MSEQDQPRTSDEDAKEVNRFFYLWLPLIVLIVVGCGKFVAYGLERIPLAQSKWSNIERVIVRDQNHYTFLIQDPYSPVVKAVDVQASQVQIVVDVSPGAGMWASASGHQVRAVARPVFPSLEIHVRSLDCVDGFASKTGAAMARN